MSRRKEPRIGTRMLLVAAVAGLVVGVGLVLVTSGATAPTQPDLASMDDIALSEAPAPATQPSAEASAPPATDDATESTRAVAGDDCTRAASLADDAVTAARTSLGNWQTHYGAQIAFDNGEIDGTEAKRRWAESKEPAERNIAAFNQASDAMAADDPCADAQSDAEARARDCSARLAAAANLVTDAQPAMDDWLAHLEMMATRDEYAIEEYLAIWRQAVTDAPDAMETFETAVRAYEEAGDCPTERAASREPIASPVAARSDTPGRSDVTVTCVLPPGRPSRAHTDV